VKETEKKENQGGRRGEEERGRGGKK